jgi:predicted DNA-binding ribbon-helix-helix protein
MSQIASSTPIEFVRPMRMNKGALQKRSMRIAGHRTSIALEPEFWQALEKVARARDLSLPALIAGIDAARATEAPNASLASAVRVHVLQSRV